MKRSGAFFYRSERKGGRGKTNREKKHCGEQPRLAGWVRAEKGAKKKETRASRVSFLPSRVANSRKSFALILFVAQHSLYLPGMLQMRHKRRPNLYQHGFQFFVLGVGYQLFIDHIDNFLVKLYFLV